MNHVYRLVWSSASGLWCVAGENSRRQGKTGRALIGAGSVLALTLSGNAWSLELADFNPVDNDNQRGATIVLNGGEHTLTGSASRIATGRQPSYGTTYGQLEAEGKLAEGSPSIMDKNRLIFGDKIGVTSPDSVTGSNAVVPVYVSSNIKETSHADRYIVAYENVGDDMYVNARVGTVESSGGALRIDIGDGASSVFSTDNAIEMRAKQTSLFYADGTGTEDSNIVWNSRNSVDFGGVLEFRASDTVTTTLVTPVYAGTVTAFDGSQHEVHSVEDLRAYNDWLVEQVQAGNLAGSSYGQEFDRAYTTELQQVAFDFDLDDGDEGAEELGINAVIHASGANATGRIADGAQIDAQRAGFRYGASGKDSAVMRGDNGGTIINDGMLAVQAVATGMVTTGAGSTAINNGVISAGFLHGDGLPDTTQPNALSDYAPYYTEGRAVLVTKGASFTNNGIMNVASPDFPNVNDQMLAVYVTDEGSIGVNNGTINVGVNNGGSNPAGGNGAVTSFGATFINELDGEIYLGRAAQYDVNAPESVEDTTPTTSQTGIRASIGGNVENKGTVTLGTGVQNSHAVTVGYSKDESSVINSGIININGQASAAPLLNTGILAENSANATILNSGDINLNGVNGVGLMAVAKGTPTTITSTGNININGAADPTSGTRNFGAWAEGSDAYIDFDDGSVTLGGDGAIGVHARNGGNIVVDGGAINFESGSDQVGYFAYGEGSSIDITSASSSGLDASTQNSTLFRIEDGAAITAAGGELAASGDGATALQVTGDGSTANLDALNISVSGQGATALKVEGGATGSMTGSSNLTLNDGAVAVVVDDNKYDLSGAVAAQGESVFTNSADISVVDAQDVTLFRVKNGAELINSGKLDLADGTAVELSGAGSKMKPDANGVAGTITVRDGVAGIHVMDGATLETSNDITVDGSASGVLVGADAGRVVINSDAHITGLGSGYGNLITNQATAATTLVDGAILEMEGSGAAILSESNLDQASHGQILVSSEVEGKGIALSNADGSVSDGSLTVDEGWDIDVTGNGSGLYANTTGDLVVDTTIDVSGAGNAIKSDAAGTVLVDKGALLTTINRDAILVEGSIGQLVNQGRIEQSAVSGIAVQLDDGDNTFVNTADGVVIGAIELGGGNDTALVGGSIIGDLDGGEGSDTYEIENARIEGGIFDGGSDDDVIHIRSSNIEGSVSGGSVAAGDGNDIITVDTASILGGEITGLGGDDQIVIAGSVAPKAFPDGPAVYAGTGSDTVLIQEGAEITGGVSLAEIVDPGGSMGRTPDYASANTFEIQGGHIDGAVTGDGGADTFTLRGGEIGGLDGLDGDDTVIQVGNSARYGRVDGGAGRNTMIYDGVTNAVADAGNAGQLNNMQHIHLANGTVMDMQRDLWTTASVHPLATGNALNIDASSTLNVSSSQTLSGDLNTSGRVNIGSDGDTRGNTFTIDGDLSGAGTFGMQTDLASEQGDLLDVRGTASGDHTLVIADSGLEPAFGGGELKVVGTGGGDGQFGLLGGHVDAGAFRYTLEQRDTDWYLHSPVRDLPDPAPWPVVDPADPVDPVDPTPVVPVDPTPDDYSDGTNMAIGNQAALGTLANAGMDTLIERLGDVHMGKENGGVWVRGMARSNNISTDTSRAFDQEIQGHQIGADTAIHRDSGTWLLGGMVGQSRSDNSFDGGASSDIDSVDGGLYGTYVGDDGWYYDAVVTVNDFDVDSEHVTNVGEKVEGSYDTHGFGASIETGKRYDYDDGWYVEPQAQLRMYQIQGESYIQDDGLRVENDDITSVQSHVGVLGGRSFQLENGTPVDVYAKASWITEHDGESTTTVNGHDFDVELPGSWLEVGAGMNVKVTENSKIFMDVEYADGDDMESPWGATVGYRYNW